jgi:hypothetical protein
MRSLTSGIGLAALFLYGATASATPINVSGTRIVIVSESGVHIWGPTSPYTALGAFSESLSEILGGQEVSAVQSSDIQPAIGLFSGTGASSVGFSVLEDQRISPTRPSARSSM